MNDFPLAPFLASLAIDGIRVTLNDYDRIGLVLRTGGPWTVKRLREVLLALLVQNQEQEEAFLHRFDNFFDLRVEEANIAYDVNVVLENLRKIAEKSDSPLPSDALPTPVIWIPPLAVERRKKWPGLKFKFGLWYAISIILIIGLCLSIYFTMKVAELTPPPPPTNEQQSSFQTEQERANLTTEVKSVNEAEPLPTEPDWKDVAGLVAAFLIPVMFYGLFLWASNKADSDKPPVWDPDKPRLFPLEMIGGKPAPRFDSATLDQIADSLGYFQSDQASNSLDVAASVRATGERGGLTTLIFRRRKHLRSVYILEDAFADGLAWNSVSVELAEGLKRRGINVMYGRFFGSPVQFHMEDGSTRWLDDLEDQRSNSLLLIFSDGKNLQHPRDVFVLESLSRWPMVAWMELREQEFWDDSTALVARYKIPVHTASPLGVLAAMERFVAERGSQEDYSSRALRWRGIPANVGADLSVYVETLLGDALPWAQACAMIQPITIALADSLRLRFQPHLPAERIERLFMLPGTAESVSGLRFSLPVVAVLRSGFVIRWEKDEQEQILQFLLDQIRAVEPKETDSIAHMAWEWTLERVRLELQPDQALKRLAQLDKTPLRDAIRADLESVVLPDTRQQGQAIDDTTKIVLRVKPESEKGLERLARLAKNVNAEKFKLLQKITADFRRAAYILGRVQLGLRIVARSIRKINSLGRSDLINTNAEARIIAEPSKLLFKNLGRKKRYSKWIAIRSAGTAPLLAEVAADKEWLQLGSTLIDAGSAANRVKIIVDATKMRPGSHSASIRFTDLVDQIDVPVIATVVESFWKRCAEWWQENKPPMAARFAFASLSLAIVAVLMTPMLEANWLNKLFNDPPVLEKVEAQKVKGDPGEQIILTAVAKDPDNDALAYEWDAGGYSVTNNFDGTASVEIPSDAFDPGESSFAVRIKLIDGRGGESIYRTEIALDVKQSPPQDRPPTTTATATAGDDEKKPGRAPLVPAKQKPPNVEPGRGKITLLSRTSPGSEDSTLFFVRFEGWSWIGSMSDNSSLISTGEIPTGDYKIEFFKTGYSPVVKSGTLSEGENLTVSVEWTRDLLKPSDSPQTGYLYASSSDSNEQWHSISFDIFLNGSPLPLKPLTGYSGGANVYELPVGTHDLRVTVPGYKDNERQVVIEPNKTGYISFNMMPLTDGPSEQSAMTASVTYQKAIEAFNNANPRAAIDMIDEALKEKTDDPHLLHLKELVAIQTTRTFLPDGQDVVQLFIPAQVVESVKAVRPRSAQFTSGDFVIVLVEITDKGEVASSKYFSGPRQLQSAAEGAALKWKFSPATYNGKPEQSRQLVIVEFMPK